MDWKRLIKKTIAKYPNIKVASDSSKVILPKDNSEKISKKELRKIIKEIK